MFICPRELSVVGPLSQETGTAARAISTSVCCKISFSSSALDTSIGLTAGLALAGVLPGLEYACGLGTGSLLAADVVSPSERLIPVDGVLPVFRAAPEPLAELQLLDAAALKEWTQRLQRCAQLLGGGVTTTS